MAWTKYQFILAFILVLSGCIITITNKYADSLKSKSRDGKMRYFHHPFFQALYMFVGEACCMIAFKILYWIYSRRGDGSEDREQLTTGNRVFNPIVFIIPATCDMIASSLLFIGLILTYAASYQMLASFTVVFVALLSMICLKRVLKLHHWGGILLIIVGLCIVGLSDFLSKKQTQHGTSDIVLGDVLIVTAQIFTAIQLIIQEVYVSKLNITPLVAVGYEGTFGFCLLGLLHFPFYYIKVGPPLTNNPRGVLEDIVDAFVQLSNNGSLLCLVIVNIVALAFLNFAGLSFTKELSATSRVVIGNIRTVIIWIFSLFLFGEKFYWIQLIGFCLLIVGMCMYYNITCDFCWKKTEAEE